MDYFRSDGNHIFLEASYAEFYIPMYYFKGTGGFAEDLGSTVKTLGVFDVGFFENGKLKEMRVLNVPTWINLIVNDSENREVQLTDGLIECRVLKYNKGEKIMLSSVVQDSDNVEAYLNFVTKGKVPSLIPYDKTLKVWKKNQQLNGASLGVPSVIEEMILSVAYRDKDNPSVKFAHKIGKDLSVSQHDYVMNNIRQICQYTSTFTALTFEDLDSMVTTSLNRTRTKGNEAVSPIEDLVKL